jgi:hypothetical protein
MRVLLFQIYTVDSPNHALQLDIGAYIFDVS